MGVLYWPRFKRILGIFMAKQKAQHPLILRYHRMIEAFSKSDDERDFYLDKVEGFLLYLDLDKGEEEITTIEAEISAHPDRYCLVPKLTFYETKKFMEGFVHEKVYDIDTKEKLLDVIGSRDSRENFLEFIYDHLTELDKWQQYYHERSRIRIIEWLKLHDFHFVFEEDLSIPRPLMEKVKESLFDAKVPKDVQGARDTISAKSKTYYSSEALNPRPKRGRPPKQQAKVEEEPQLTPNIYRTTPPAARPFLFIPDYNAQAITFSTKFDTEAQMMASLKGTSRQKVDVKLELLSQRLESLRHISGRLSTFSEGELGKESKMVREVASELDAEPSKEKLGIAGVFKGILPKKKEKDSESKRPKPKTVTNIKYKGKGKGKHDK